MHIETYTDLDVTYVEDPQRREEFTQGYHFVIQNGHSAHSAHYTLLGLVSWMKFRGLDFGKHVGFSKNSMSLVPGYRTVSTMNEEYFAIAKKLWPDTVPFLSNGRYTEAVRVPADQGGLVTLIYLNVNVKGRKESLNMYDKDLVVGLLEGIFG